MHLINDRVLLKRTVEKKEKEGLIYIPEAHQKEEKLSEAEVVEVGTGKTLNDGTVKSLVVKTGDRVLVGQYAGIVISFKEEPYLIVREDEILAILEEGE